MNDNSENTWSKLSEIAWKVAENAYTKSDTIVGSAIESDNGEIYFGCNIQHIFRSHDIHAEVNAIGNMISNGGREINKILVVAKKELFTPCGSCMDWIVQFSTDRTLVGFQNDKNGEIQIFTPKELMPFYPKN